MSSKHTPGPWAVHDHPTDPNQFGHHVTTVDGLTICSVTYQLPSGTAHGVEEATRVANARLIAAAPELLAIVIRELRNGEQSHFEDWLERTCPSGDVEAVKRQWLGSADYAVFADEYREELAVLDKIEGSDRCAS